MSKEKGTKQKPEPRVSVDVYEKRDNIDHSSQQPEKFVGTGCKVLENGDMLIKNVRVPFQFGTVVSDLVVPHGKWRKVELSPIPPKVIP